MLIGFAPHVLGGYAAFHFGLYWLLGLIGLIVLYFGFVEIRMMCSHCPHYAEPELKSLKCWANYGSIKLWKYRPGPMSKIEKAIFLIGMATVYLYPSPLFFVQKMWFLGAFHLMIVAGFFTTLIIFLCSQCCCIHSGRYHE